MSRDSDYLYDMYDSCQSVIRYTEGLTWELFQINHEKQLVVERLLELTGKGARSISNEFRQLHPEVPWSDLIGLRIIIAHKYRHIDLDSIWKICQNDVPVLSQKLQRILDQD